MNCTNCRGVIENSFEKEFCTVECYIVWSNNLRLIFPSENYFGMNERPDIDTLKAGAHAALTKLIAQRTFEQNMELCEVLTSVVVQQTALILPQRAKKEIEGRLEAQKKRASKIAEEVNERDSGKILSSAAKRAQAELIKTEGVRASEDGKCQFCKSATVGTDFCSAEHKQMFKAAMGFVKTMRIDLQTAIQMVSEIK